MTNDKANLGRESNLAAFCTVPVAVRPGSHRVAIPVTAETDWSPDQALFRPVVIRFFHMAA